MACLCEPWGQRTVRAHRWLQVHVCPFTEGKVILLSAHSFRSYKISDQNSPQGLPWWRSG